MKARLMIAAIAALAAAPAQAADWWWIGLNGDAPNRVVTYVDRETLASKRDGAVEIWALAIGETALPNGQQHQATHYSLNCRSRRYATIGRIAYDEAGAELPTAPIPPGDFAPVSAGSIGESILNFACGRPSGMELQVPQPAPHAIRYLRGEGQAPSPPADRGEESGTSLGTGFFIGPAGHLLTSFHVVAGAERVSCRTQDGRMHEARLVRLSQASDLALLQIDVRPIHYLSFGAPGAVRSGDRVFTVGYGAPSVLGISEPRFTDGTVSALSGEGGENAYLQISVPVQPGNSGGPLVNEAGQVVGVIAAQAAVDEFMRRTGTLPQNINWAVKAEYATPLMAPMPVQPPRTRAQAIELARNSVCLVVAERRSE